MGTNQPERVSNVDSLHELLSNRAVWRAHEVKLTEGEVDITLSFTDGDGRPQAFVFNRELISAANAGQLIIQMTRMVFRGIEADTQTGDSCYIYDRG